MSVVLYLHLAQLNRQLLCSSSITTGNSTCYSPINANHDRIWLRKGALMTTSYLRDSHHHANQRPPHLSHLENHRIISRTIFRFNLLHLPLPCFHCISAKIISCVEISQQTTIMDRLTHVIDPDGEVIILLQNPNAPFAELSEALTSDNFTYR